MPDIRDYTRVTPEFYTWWRALCQVFVVICFTIIFNTVWKVHIAGKENLPKRGQHPKQFVVVANHSSNWDPPFISYLLKWRPIAYMAKKELFETPLTRTIYRSLGAIAVNRQKVDKSSIKSCKTVLTQTTWLLGLFPEGTRHKDPNTLGSFKSGVCAIAKMGQAPILPVGIQRVGRHVQLVIGEMLPVPTDPDIASEQLAVRMLELKLEAGQLLKAI